MSSYPPFSLERPKFDQTTYIGRVKRCFDITDPLTLFVSQNELEESVRLIEDFKNGKRGQVTDAQLWRAKKIKEAIIHPDSGEKILAPFRMSGYVPFGTISVIGMLIPGASFKQVFFWQWLNQSHNACVNYANRNASKPTATATFVKSYFGAVGGAVSIALTFSFLIKNTKRLSPQAKLFASRFVAYPATSTANVCNVYMMRSSELQEGVEVRDEQGMSLGVSKLAANKAVMETALSRVALPAPILVLPPLIMSLIERSRLLNKRLLMPVNALVCTLAFGLALPFTIAMFPQTTKMKASQLEEHIATKSTTKYVVFNKGL